MITGTESPDMTCRECGATIPPAPTRNGLPRVFCGDICSQRWHWRHRHDGESDEIALAKLALRVPRIRRAVWEALR